MLQSPNTPKRIAIFVDVQNIYYTTRDTFGRSFNYRLFWQEISAQGDIVVANAYAIDRNDDQQHKFQKALKHIGFNVKLKPFIQRSDGTAKGDWDVGITIDVMETAANNANRHAARPRRTDRSSPKIRVSMQARIKGISVPTMPCRTATLSPIFASTASALLLSP